MMSRMLLIAVTAGGLVLVTGCQSPVQDDRVAVGEDDLGFFGPARAQLDFGKLPVIQFYPGAWVLSDPENARLAAASTVLADGGRLLLVGVGDAEVPSEHGRQQALARALVVRRELVRRGAEAAHIRVTGLAAEEAVGLTGRIETGPRVECAVLR